MSYPDYAFTNDLTFCLTYLLLRRKRSKCKKSLAQLKKIKYVTFIIWSVLTKKYTRSIITLAEKGSDEAEKTILYVI